MAPWGDMMMMMTVTAEPSHHRVELNNRPPLSLTKQTHTDVCSSCRTAMLFVLWSSRIILWLLCVGFVVCTDTASALLSCRCALLMLQSNENYNDMLARTVSCIFSDLANIHTHTPDTSVLVFVLGVWIFFPRHALTARQTGAEIMKQHRGKS